MIRIAILAAIAAILVSGCNKPDEAAAGGDANATTSGASAASTAGGETMMAADMGKCACGAEVKKADMVDVNGTMMCKDCADKAKGGDMAMAKCEGCGHDHAKSEMVDVNGKMMCKDCADKAKADAS